MNQEEPYIPPATARKIAQHELDGHIGKRRANALRWYHHNKSRAKANNSAWNRLNPDYKTRYRKENREKIAATNAEYRRKNADRIRAAGRQYYQANLETIRARYRAKYQSRREAYSFRSRNRRARLKASCDDDTTNIWCWEQRWKARASVRCYWCGEQLPPKRCHSDHITAIANGGRHSIANMCIACSKCNLRKNDAPLQAWNSRIAEPVLAL